MSDATPETPATPAVPALPPQGINKILGDVPLEAQHILGYLIKVLAEAQKAFLSSDLYKEFTVADKNFKNFLIMELHKVNLNERIHGVSMDLKHFIELALTPVVDEAKKVESTVSEEAKKVETSLTETIKKADIVVDKVEKDIGITH